MGNYLTSVVGNNQNDEELTLENACKLLENQQKQKKIDDENTSCNLQNVVSTRIGEITEVIGDSYVIDGSYIFTNTETDFTIGSKVSYNLFSSDNRFIVSNVEMFNEWGSIDDCNNLWNSRILICQVEKRIGRDLYLSAADIIINIDEIPLEFLPLVGDWLELDVKCMINENNLDLKGRILEINKVSPLRLHIEVGKVTNWKPNDEVGTINNKIFFNKSALSMGYIPLLGDKVVAEVIESDQNRCSWRAIKLLPESMSITHGNLSKSNISLSDCKDSFPGLDMKEIDLNFEKLNDKQGFSINICNTSEQKFTLQNAEFLDSSGQCKVIDNTVGIEICPGDQHNILCECVSKNIGQSKEYCVLTFDHVMIAKSVNILCSLAKTREKVQYDYKTRLKPHEESNNELVRGQKSNTPRFSAAQIPYYTVPQRLIDLVMTLDMKDIQTSIEQLKIMKPSLVSNLTHLNYEDKFHTLLHLDEIANLIAIRTYDQDRVCFVRNAEYLMLEIDNLSERRPSLVVGDRIIATDPMNQKGLDFEAFIQKVGAKHVYITFNHLFHDNYNGEDYSIKVVPGRAAYRRLHHGVHLAVRNLGQELLFPVRVDEKETAVNFFDEQDSPVSSPTGVSKSKIKNVLSKIQENKQKSLQLNNSIGDGDKTVVKLEWYNKKLNCMQKDAVRHILWGKARPLPYIIFGPPGTGKTVTIIEAILQIVRLVPTSRLLVTAPSNSAADLIALRLIESGVLKPGDLVRVISYNYAVSDMIPVKLIPYCATASPAKEDTTTRNISSSGIQFDCTQSTLGRHRITVATCSASGQFFNLAFSKGHFSHIIVDEAAQAGEPDVMIPLAFLDKNSGQVILAGDPMQLGPVVLCKIASECGLNESYLERLINRFPYVRDSESFLDTCGFNPKLVTKLLYNYRALPDILNLYNMLFYDNELMPTIDERHSEEATLLECLQEMLPKRTDGGVAQICFHGVDGENYQTADSPSWFNPDEAAQVFYYVNELYRLGLNSTNIGIITPYIKQVKEIRSLFTEAEFDVPRVGTIEEFQGQEFNVILLSTVRSCEEYLNVDIAHSLGFVASPKRLNVAISRAKSLLVVIGNPKLLSRDTYWRSVLKYCMEKNCYVGCDF